MTASSSRRGQQAYPTCQACRPFPLPRTEGRCRPRGRPVPLVRTTASRRCGRRCRSIRARTARAARSGPCNPRMPSGRPSDSLTTLPRPPPSRWHCWPPASTRWPLEALAAGPWLRLRRRMRRAAPRSLRCVLKQTLVSPVDSLFARGAKRCGKEGMVNASAPSSGNRTRHRRIKRGSCGAVVRGRRRGRK